MDKSKSKKIKKILVTVSVVLTIACLLLVLFYNLAPIFSVYTDTSERFYPDAKVYQGWEVVFYSYGGQVIKGYYHFSFNFVLIAAMFAAIIAAIVFFCLIRRKKGKNRAILEIVIGAILIVCGILLVLARELCYALSISDDIVNYVADAKATGGFNLLAYPIITCIVMCMTGVFKFVHAGYLLTHRKKTQSQQSEQIENTQPVA